MEIKETDKKEKLAELADLIFPEITKTIEDYKQKYPERTLKEGARVTRFAPSPTGFVHIGNFFQALISVLNARRSDGIFYLRNEDTDKKREKEGAMALIIKVLKDYNITPDEYEEGSELVGNYGPYVQSKRKEIYHTFIKHLIKIDKAYPAFETSEELENIREIQVKTKVRTGYYGMFAKSRFLSVDQMIEKIKNGENYTIRFKSNGDFDKKVIFTDEIRGKIVFPQNDVDAVIMKSDNLLPTYHFAHVVDDFLMHTTHVTRGEEWLSSVPLHLEMFAAFGFTAPKYLHNPLIMKKDGDIIRKLSKRKDPETSMKFYEEEGYPQEAVIDSLMTIINSNFESWREENPDKSYLEFPFSVSKMNSSGALYSLDKLNNISKNLISRFTKEQLYNKLLLWTEKYDAEFNQILLENPEYSKTVLNIEREAERPRKDFINYKSIKEFTWYMFDKYFYNQKLEYPVLEKYKKEEIKEVLDGYLKIYNESEDKQVWFDKCKELAESLNFAINRKEYKENPEKFKGNMGDFTNIIRIVLTTKEQTPELYEICKILGKTEMQKRFEYYLNK